MPKNDLAGTRFGRLLVVSHAEYKTKSGQVRSAWNCVCDCGTTKTIIGYQLLVGRTMSCGCLRKEVSRNRKIGTGSQRFKNPLYKVYVSMIRRCYVTKTRSYKNYGARGITVCDRWKNAEYGFENFIADMGLRPDGMMIERKDNNGNYCPENCKWATAAEQNRNYSRNNVLTINGLSKCVSDWSLVSGILPRTIITRLSFGWSPEDAVFKPVDPKRSRNHDRRKRDDSSNHKEGVGVVNQNSE